MKVGEYIKEALIESLKEEITEGEFCSLLASRLDDGKKVDGNNDGENDNYPFVE